MSIIVVEIYKKVTIYIHCSKHLFCAVTCTSWKCWWRFETNIFLNKFWKVKVNQNKFLIYWTVHDIIWFDVHMGYVEEVKNLYFFFEFLLNINLSELFLNFKKRTTLFYWKLNTILIENNVKTTMPTQLWPYS